MSTKTVSLISLCSLLENVKLNDEIFLNDIILYG